MSNRIRILFHCDLEGLHVAHVGLRALKAMEALSQNMPEALPTTEPTGEVWVSFEEWLDRRKPKFLKKRARIGPHGLEESFLLAARPAQKAPTTGPVPKSLVERAHHLWESLPQQVKHYSQLKVVREPRNRRWRHSTANPFCWGWTSPKASSKASVGPVLTSGGYTSGGYTTYTTPLPPDGPLQQAPEITLDALHSKWGPPSVDPTSKASLYEKMAEDLATYKEKVYKAAVQKKAPPKKQRLSFGKPTVSPILVDGDFFDSPEDHENAKAPKAPTKASASGVPPKTKPRLRLGIWS